MHQSRPVRLVLDIDPDGEPIRGQLSVLDRGCRPFFGWLELVGAVEAARHPTSSTKSPGTHYGTAQDSGLRRKSMLRRRLTASIGRAARKH
jgi:hypothetical protein